MKHTINNKCPVMKSLTKFNLGAETQPLVKLTNHMLLMTRVAECCQNVHVVSSLPRV